MTRASRLPAPLRILFGLLKVGCIALGLPLTVICLMAICGSFTASGWARLVVGVLGGTLLPLFLVDRMLPEDTERGQGLATDLLAVFFVAVPLLYAGAAQGFSRKALALEGDRLAAASWGRVAGVAYWLGGLRLEAPAPAPKTGSVTTRPDAGRRADARAPAARPDAGPRRDAAARADARRPDSAPSKLTPAEIFRRFAGSIVFIRSERGGGTGFLIDAKGTVATNSHVIHAAAEVEVKLKDGTILKEVELLVEDEGADLALLAIKGSKLPPALRLGDSDKVAVGEPAVAIGNPLGLEHTLTDGLISSRRVYRGKRWLQISVPLSPGNSGGPLFNLAGEVIGVNTATVSIVAQNLNLAVPISELKKLVKDSYPGRRSIGSATPGAW